MAANSTGKVAFGPARPFNGVKVFSATMVQEREGLGERITAWLGANRGVELCEAAVTQSSDEAFHCITITLFFRDPAR